MATTTWEAIRDNLVTAIEALTPASHSSVAFRYAPRLGVEYQVSGGLREWAGANAASCMRRFDIRYQGWERTPVQHPGIAHRRGTAEIVVAYPKHYALYGGDNAGDLDATMEVDISALMNVVGEFGAANYPAGSVPVGTDAVDLENEVEDEVAFASSTFTFEYEYDLT